MKKKILGFLLIPSIFILSIYGPIFFEILFPKHFASAKELTPSDTNKKATFKKTIPLKNDKPKHLNIISQSPLPTGTVGKKYTCQIHIPGTSSHVIFNLDKKSSLPPGLKLDANGSISGIPITLGSYSFLVNLKNASGDTIEKRKFTIKILRKLLDIIRVIPEPETIKIIGEKTLDHEVTYSFAPAIINKRVQGIKLSTSPKQTKPASLILTSDKGVFLEDGNVLKTIKAPLRVCLNNNTGKISESLTFPIFISKKVVKNKSSHIIYKRVFESRDNSLTLTAKIIIKKAEGEDRPDKTDNKPSYVKGQIVVVAKDSKTGRKLPNHLSKKYNLKIDESFSIKSLKKRITVFKTDEPVLQLIKQIKKEKGVIQVQTNNIFGTMTEPKSDMQTIATELNFPKLHKRYRGKGVIVAVIDTGVDIKHRDLKDRIILYKNLLKDSSYKAEIHGTGVAGIIASSINGFGIEGIAPEVKLIALRACRQISDNHPEGIGNTFSIIKALDIAIDKKARIVNMSFGSLAPDNLIKEILREGSKRNILFLAPVGNVSGSKGPTFPASSPYVIAVGGIDAKGDFYPDASLASKASVCAPAVNVLTTVPNNRYNFLNGTSISTAIVSGILAVAVEEKGIVRKKQLPRLDNNICSWTEKLMQISICKK